MEKTSALEVANDRLTEANATLAGLRAYEAKLRSQNADQAALTDQLVARLDQASSENLKLREQQAAPAVPEKNDGKEMARQALQDKKNYQAFWGDSLQREEAARYSLRATLSEIGTLKARQAGKDGAHAAETAELRDQLLDQEQRNFTKLRKMEQRAESAERSTELSEANLNSLRAEVRT